jgi:alpha-tubulin suppressor-like RCC1 family protein
MNLPQDILTEISQYLSVESLCQLKLTARFFRPTVHAALIKKLSLQKIKQIAIGFNYTIFLQQDGSVWACGSNAKGELGIGHQLEQNSLIKVPVDNVARVIVDYCSTFFIKKDGSIWACGDNECGRLGIGSQQTSQSSPVKVLLDNVAQVITEMGHTFFIKTDGSVWACGSNFLGQLGIGEYQPGQNSPVKIAVDNVAQLMTLMESTLFIRNDGSIWGCTQGKQREIFKTPAVQPPRPMSIGPIPLDNIAQIFLGVCCVFYIKTDGSIWAWGRNDCGQLGIGPTTTVSSRGFLKVHLDNVAQLISAYKSTFFIKTDGSVWACGDNKEGQLGIGQAKGSQYNPVKVSIDRVAQVIAGNLHTFFIKTDGSVWACGNNDKGQLGIGHYTNHQYSTVKVPIDDVAQVIAGKFHTFFVKSDGSVWACGNNEKNQLGINSADINIFNIQPLPHYQHLQALLQQLQETGKYIPAPTPHSKYSSDDSTGTVSMTKVRRFL